MNFTSVSGKVNRRGKHLATIFTLYIFTVEFFVGCKQSHGLIFFSAKVTTIRRLPMEYVNVISEALFVLGLKSTVFTCQSFLISTLTVLLSNMSSQVRPAVSSEVALLTQIFRLYVNVPLVSLALLSGFKFFSTETAGESAATSLDMFGRSV